MSLRLVLVALTVLALTPNSHAQDLLTLQATARHCLSLAGAARTCGIATPALSAQCETLARRSGLPQHDAWQVRQAAEQGRWISPSGHGPTCQTLPRLIAEFSSSVR